MAEIVLAYCSSHAPMMSAAREAATEEQRQNVFGVGDIEEGFDRWFLDHLAPNDLEDVLSLPDEELKLAGNGADEIRSSEAGSTFLAQNYTGLPLG